MEEALNYIQKVMEYSTKIKKMVEDPNAEVWDDLSGLEAKALTYKFKLEKLEKLEGKTAFIRAKRKSLDSLYERDCTIPEGVANLELMLDLDSLFEGKEVK